MNSDSDTGLICAYLLDGEAKGRALDWREILSWQPDDGPLWVHLDYTAPQVQRWMREESGLGSVICDALLAEETRPRCTTMGAGLLLTLRGVNLNPDSDPEDMVAIRLWSDGQRVISLRRRRLLAIQDLRDAIAGGQAPRTCGELIVMLSERLVARMADILQSLEERVDELEEAVLTEESHQLRPRLAQVRRQSILLRRYLAPQREALTRLHGEKSAWLGEHERLLLRETADRTTRYIEDLDTARERAAVVQEELNSRLSEQMDRRMYVLSIVAALFLPLGFITGLLGINVGGIPGADVSDAFLMVSFGLVILVAAQILIFKWRRWF